MNKVYWYQRVLIVLVWLVEKAWIGPSKKPDWTIAYLGQVQANGLVIKGEITEMELREGQQITATVVLKTRSGNPGQHEAGTEAWESSDPSVATVEVNPENALEAVIKGVNGSNNDSVVITFSADGDPDEDQVRPIVATADVVVTQGEAFVAELQLSGPTDIPEDNGEPTEPTEPGEDE